MAVQSDSAGRVPLMFQEVGRNSQIIVWYDVNVKHSLPSQMAMPSKISPVSSLCRKSP